MKYYEVLAAHSFGQRTSRLLTYHSSESLVVGQLVVVPHGQSQRAGVIWQAVGKPAFKTKSVSRSLPLPALSSDYLAFLEWFSGYYATSLGLALQAALPPRLASLSKPAPPLNDGPVTAISKLPPLSADQRRVVASIRRVPAGSQWLHGETGSGKTRVYMELAQASLDKGQDVLVLVPEISLSSQTRQQFEAKFAGKVQLIHSRLSDVTRRRLWCQALLPHPPQIWLGTRSALFLPLARLGLIVIDECHDSSYKQDNAPRYHAAAVASQLAKLHRASLLLGSATPSVSDMYMAERKQLPVHRVTEPVRARAKLQLNLVDMRDYRPAKGASRWLSPALEAALEATLQRKEQAIIFLNRRGSASLILCQHCGWQAVCPYCQLPQTYHADSHQRVCHTCGRRQAMPTSCPQCSQPELMLRGCGTKEIERLLAERFPRARLLRLDQDSSQSAKLDKYYNAMRDGLADIIIGTQMITKGFDLPNVTMIGVVHADAALSLPDFAASERTFQLLYQVIGRGGRHLPRNHVVIQTYRPDHPAIALALKRDWEGFYNQELAARKSSGFPPHRFLLHIRCRERQPAKAQRILNELVASLPPTIRSLGPSPAWHGRSGDYHIWQLACLARQRGELVKLVTSLPASCQADLDPIDLL